jgi:hypothetical protein
MILKSDSTRTNGIEMQLSEGYRNNFFSHGVADIEQIATPFFSRIGTGVKVMPLDEIFFWPPPFLWRTTD